MPVTDRDPVRAGARLAAAVREAGELAHKSFRQPVKQWTKDKNSPVSEVDIAVNDFLRTRLATPGIGWLSEEDEGDPGRHGAALVWVVDPIDGTRAYLAGLPDWSIAVALVAQGRPVTAAVFAPVTGEFFLASAGGGTTLNGKPVGASPGHNLSGARLAGPKFLLDRITATAAGAVTLPKIHSLALRLARVANGGVDVAFASSDSHDWDLAAADLLVHEAGGVMTTLAGQTLRYNERRPVHPPLVAAGRERHQALVDLLGERKRA